MVKSILSAPHFRDEAAALEFIEARLWPKGPVCPRCGETERVGRMGGKSTKLGQCKCYACRKPFAVTIGTVMESSHIPLHVWLQAMHLLCASKKGISSNQLHRVLGVTLKSAWFLSHRIRAAMAEGGDIIVTPMGGGAKTVEADETYMGPRPLIGLTSRSVPSRRLCRWSSAMAACVASMSPTWMPQTFVLSSVATSSVTPFS